MSSSSAIPERLQAAIEDGALGVEADASREDVLKRVGIERARGLIAAVGTDAENVYAVLSARVMRPDLFIVGRAETDDATQKLKRAGADRVISPYQIGAMQIAQTALRPAVVDFVELATSSENLDLAMEEITIAASSPLASAIDSRREPAPALRRDRRRHPAARSIDGIQSRARHGDSRRRQARRARPAGLAAAPRGRGRRPMTAQAARRHGRRQSDPRRIGAGRRRVHGACRPPAGAGDRPGRRRSCIGHLRRGTS